MTMLLSTASIAASAWVIWRLHKNSKQLDRAEADMTRLLGTMEP